MFDIDLSNTTLSSLLSLYLLFSNFFIKRYSHGTLHSHMYSLENYPLPLSRFTIDSRTNEKKNFLGATSYSIIDLCIVRPRVRKRGKTENV